MERYDDPGQEHVPYTMEEKVHSLEVDGYEIKIEHYIREGWNIFKQSPGQFVIMALLIAVFQSIGTTILPDWLEWIVTFLLVPVYLGFGVAAGKVVAGENISISDFFIPYDRFFDLIVGYLVMVILVGIGIILLVIPGIYLAVALSFTLYFIYFGKQDFWESIKYSRRVIHRKWLNFFVFILALIFLNLLGLLALVVGLLITVPVTLIAVYLAYKDIVEGEAESVPGTL